MISYEYIYNELPYNRELDSELGVGYANDGKSIRFDPVRVEVENWVEEKIYPHDCVSHGDCERCSNNQDFSVEIMIIRTNKTSYRFTRTLSHQLGGIWSNWYDESDIPL